MICVKPKPNNNQEYLIKIELKDNSSIIFLGHPSILWYSSNLFFF